MTFTSMKDRNGCAHTATEVRWLVCSDARRQYWRQCLGCGQLLGTALPATAGAEATQMVDQKLRDQGLQDYLTRMRGVRADINAKRRIEYTAYLQTPAWAKRRAKVLKRAAGLCEGCGERHATQVHHLTYERIYREMLFDLVAVCDSCHNAIHEHREAAE